MEFFNLDIQKKIAESRIQQMKAESRIAELAHKISLSSIDQEELQKLKDFALELKNLINVYEINRANPLPSVSVYDDNGYGYFLLELQRREEAIKVAESKMLCAKEELDFFYTNQQEGYKISSITKVVIVLFILFCIYRMLKLLL